MKINEDNLLTAVITGSTILLLTSGLVSFLFISRPVSYGILAGGLIAVINFVWQRSVMRRVLSIQPAKPAAFVTARYVLRLGITAVLLYQILTSGYFSVAGLFVGLSVVVIMIVIFTVYLAIQNKGD
jgi:hypothetical protein